LVSLIALPVADNVLIPLIIPGAFTIPVATPYPIPLDNLESPPIELIP